MASIPQHAPVADVDRRRGARAELCLGVTLRQSGAQAIIPAEITNLSATGFLAEFPEGVEIPQVLDVELPHAGIRTAQVVWANGWMAGCSFSQPLTKSEISAARLKSEPRPMQVELPQSLSPASLVIDSTDPIWDTSNEARPGERWSLRTRLVVLGAAGTLPWLSIAGLVALLA
jgi:hypothetical protein